MKNISLLGSTGSIGLNVLDVVRTYKSEFRITALAAGRYSPALESQIKEFSPRYVSVGDAATIPRGRALGRDVKFLSGNDGLRQLASLKEADIVFISVVGAVGIFPLIEAVSHGKNVALANKESVVIGGDFLAKKFLPRIEPTADVKGEKRTGLVHIRNKKGRIIPVDSEHSAIFQILEGQESKPAGGFVSRLILTASGGALYGAKRVFEKEQDVGIKDVLRHPTWKMGKKITVDSATLMNKGLEVIEAHHLFGMPYENISVVIHPQSIVHSMVEFVDGTVMAQMSPTDMRYAIKYALSYPERLASISPHGDVRKKAGNLSLGDRIKRLDFRSPDFDRFPCFALALAAGRSGGIMPAVMNAANEIAVDGFLEGRLKFWRIPTVIEKTMLSFNGRIRDASLSDIIDADIAAREKAREVIKRYI